MTSRPALQASTRRLPGWAAATLGLLFLLLGAGAVAADPAYPALTGRVVDGADVIDPAARQRLDDKLKGLEDKSGIQLVVATLPSLDGVEIEPYANGLFRAWKLGEAKNNNGVLLLVAPKERRVRIEVGYGLEGTLTDALSKVIITSAMVPRFKTGDFSGGIERGTDDVITVLSTDSSDWQKRPTLREDQTTTESPLAQVLPLVFFGLVIFLIWRASRNRGGRGGGGPWIIPPMGGGWGQGGG
ncbi:TPM domain-containing protein, partial [Lichenihabitans sp. Uapishka_5]|uniref:TPM domain-containing protein n=1 Tax=Lichenihabitans sp. Uapishka_5 TaxID=3037302 RepID=UPI0029E7D949